MADKLFRVERIDVGEDLRNVPAHGTLPSLVSKVTFPSKLYAVGSRYARFPADVRHTLDPTSSAWTSIVTLPTTASNRRMRIVSATEIDNYLDQLDEPKRSTLSRLRQTILDVVPDAEQCISYG